MAIGERSARGVRLRAATHERIELLHARAPRPREGLAGEHAVDFRGELRRVRGGARHGGRFVCARRNVRCHRADKLVDCVHRRVGGLAREISDFGRRFRSVDARLGERCGFVPQPLQLALVRLPRDFLRTKTVTLRLAFSHPREDVARRGGASESLRTLDHR